MIRRVLAACLLAAGAAWLVRRQRAFERGVVADVIEALKLRDESMAAWGADLRESLARWTADANAVMAERLDLGTPVPSPDA